MKKRIVIEIETDIKHREDDGYDCTKDVDNALCDTIYNRITDYVTGSEEFEEQCIEDLLEFYEFPDKIEEFSDLGALSIKVHEEFANSVKDGEE